MGCRGSKRWVVVKNAEGIDDKMGKMLRGERAKLAWKWDRLEKLEMGT